MAKTPELTFAQWLAKLQDPDTSLAQVGLQRLSDITGAELADFEKVWPKLDEKRRRSVIGSLTELAEENFEFDFSAVMILALSDADSTVRINAIDGLAENTDYKIADRLVTLLQRDAVPDVRAAAAAALGRFTYLIELGKADRVTAKRVQEALLASYHKPDESYEVKRRVLEALGYLCSSEVGELIEETYHSGDDRMRASAVFAMGRQCDPRWLGTILRELENDDPEMRFEAARAAGELQDEQALPKLEQMISDDDHEVRDAAIMAIGTIGTPRAKLILQACAKANDQDLREVAEEALAEMEFFEEPLKMHIEDTNGDGHKGHVH
jgi:hypothetical protein